MNFEDVSKRDAKLMTFDHPLMRSTPIRQSDVGKIFVVDANGTSARIMPQAEFAELPLATFSSWQEIGPFHINQ